MSEPGVDEATISAELDELLCAHQTEWLDHALPAGPCLLWAGGATTAAALAMDRRRTVLLIEPDQSRRDRAERRPSPGVKVVGPETAHDAGRFASVVIFAATPHSVDLDALLSLGADGMATVIVVPADQADPVHDHLRSRRSDTSVVPQRLTLASAIGTGSVVSASLPSGADQAAALVVAGIDPISSLRLGFDAGPARWWADIDQVRGALDQVDHEMGDDRLDRIWTLEQRESSLLVENAELAIALAGSQAATAAGLERVEELLGSTSWRVTAALRWVSDSLRWR